MTAGRQAPAEIGARFVATYWRDAYMSLPGPSRIGCHGLAMVLNALDGETDPVRLGLGESVRPAFLAALEATQPSPVEPLDVERLAEAIWTAETGDYLQYADPVEARKFAAAIARAYAADKGAG